MLLYLQIININPISQLKLIQLYIHYSTKKLSKIKPFKLNTLSILLDFTQIKLLIKWDSELNMQVGLSREAILYKNVIYHSPEQLYTRFHL